MQLLTKNKFVLAAALGIFCLAYFFSRASFFICPLVDWTSDSFGYMTCIERMLKGEPGVGISVFYLGYSAFVYLLLKMHDSIYSVVIAQHAFTFLSGIFLVYSTYRYYGLLSVGVAGGLAIFTLLSYNSYYDSYILTESIYTSSLILIFSLGICSIHSRSKITWSLFSLATFIPVIIRPSGIFAAMIFLFVTLFLLLNRKQYGTVIKGYVLPFTLLCIALAVINFFVLDHVGDASSAHVSQELNYESSASKRPAEFQRASFSKAVRHYSWIKEYQRADKHKKLVYQKFFEWNWPTNLQYAHPDSLYKIKERINYRFFQKEHIDAEQLKKDVFKEFYYPDKIAPLKDKYRYLTSSLVYRMYDWFEIRICEPLFRNTIWVYLFFIAFLISLFFLVKSGFSDTLAFCMVLLGLINIGHNLLHILVAHRTLPRYEYPIEFTYYVAAAFLPLLLFRAYRAFKKQ